MPIKTIFIFAASALLVFLLSACGGGGGASGVRVTEGTVPATSTATSGRTAQIGDATIVHVNDRERLATMRNGTSFPASTFLKTVDRGGEQTGFLKTRAQRPSGLRTADILEGNPNINNRAVPVSDAERVRLEELYSDPNDG